MQKLKNSIQPNIYECKICGEHHCEHDFPDEQDDFVQEMTPIMAIPPPHIVLQPPPPGHSSRNCSIPNEIKIETKNNNNESTTTDNKD